MKNENKKKNSGFTLIELMVATSIFIIIMLAAMGALFMLLDAAKSSRALRSAMDNVNFSMESMTRSIRMGTNYYCGGITMDDLISTKDCPNGGTLISFVPQPLQGVTATSRVGYQISNDGKGIVKRYDSSNSSGVPIVSPDVQIDTLKFFVKGSDNTDTIQPSVYIIMKGTVMVRGVPTSFALQTMASQRNF